MADDRLQIVTPANAPDRFTRDEAALYRKGLCGWVIEYGNGRGTLHCRKPSQPGASFGNCAEHNAELLEDFWPDGSRR